jgi:hypothetical protein
MSFGYQVLGFGSGGVGAPFLVATGGTEVTCGDYKTHIFTGPGTFCVSAVGSCAANNAVDYLTIAGGGGAAGDRAGGAGAGGFRLSNGLGLPAPTMSPLAADCGITVTQTAFPIVVGAGGTGPNMPLGVTGADTTALGLTSAGGGRSASGNTAPIAGGSGGGSYRPGTGGAGNTPPVSPPQGNSGGNAGPVLAGAGGGGAGASGGATRPAAGVGGSGSFLDDNSIGPTAPSYGTPGPTGSTRYFAGGGGGGGHQAQGNSGGAGGGGAGANPGVSGTVNTGSGGGGGSPQGGNAVGGNGGSGIVIIRYKYQ